MRPQRRKPFPNDQAAPTPAYITFQLYQASVDIARQKQDSLAWVVREAAEKYAAELSRAKRPAPGKCCPAEDQCSEH